MVLCFTLVFAFLLIFVPVCLVAFYFPPTGMFSFISHFVMWVVAVGQYTMLFISLIRGDD